MVGPILVVPQASLMRCESVLNRFGLVRLSCILPVDGALFYNLHDEYPSNIGQREVLTRLGIDELIRAIFRPLLNGSS